MNIKATENNPQEGQSASIADKLEEAEACLLRLDTTDNAEEAHIKGRFISQLKMFLRFPILSKKLQLTEFDAKQIEKGELTKEMRARLFEFFRSDVFSKFRVNGK